MRNFKIRGLLYLLFSLALCRAQTDSARIVGAVTDPSGGVIVGAKITVTNQKTGVERVVETNEQGLYYAVSLAASQYKVAVSATGLGGVEMKDVPLIAGQERRLDITLKPATVTEQVTVGGELVVVDMSSARVGANVNEREVANMPINGRQLSQLYLLTPGATTAGGGSFDNIRFSGRSNQQNAMRVDGVSSGSIIDSSPGNMNGESSSQFRLQASLENVQEFRVESSNYPAEFGTASGGQVNVATKSGSNQFHGSLFEFVRNDKFDAPNFFDNANALKKSPASHESVRRLGRRTDPEEQAVLLRFD